MTTDNQRKTRNARHKSLAKHIQRFVKSRRALSPVISSMVLIAVVIVLGFAALSYANVISDNYRADYHDSVNSDIDSLKESLAFEYCFYNQSAGKVVVYFLNAGTIESDVDKVYLSTSTGSLPYVMNYMNGTLAQNKTVPIGVERQIVLQQTLSSGTYTIRITTVRGSSFAFSFSV